MSLSAKNAVIPPSPSDIRSGGPLYRSRNDSVATAATPPTKSSSASVKSNRFARGFAGDFFRKEGRANEKRRAPFGQTLTQSMHFMHPGSTTMP